MHTEKHHFSVLVADDSEDDRLFLRFGLRNQEALKIVAEVENGEEAIAYLSGAGPYSDRQLYPFPDLLVLDLKMPRMTGFEVLDWLRLQNFPCLKIAVRSGSFLADDIAKALDLGAHAFHLKPSSREEQQHLGMEMLALLQAAAETTPQLNT